MLRVRNHSGTALGSATMVGFASEHGDGHGRGAAGAGTVFSCAASQPRYQSVSQPTMEVGVGFHPTPGDVRQQLLMLLEPTGEHREAFLRLVRSSLKDSTWTHYLFVWKRFVVFCQSRRESFLPASFSSLLAYLSHLLNQDRVHGKSIESHVSAINKIHVLLGFPAPASGALWKVMFKGFVQLTARKGVIATTRIPVPASLVYQLVQGLLRSLAASAISLPLLRRFAAVVHGFIFMERASSVVAVRCCDLEVTDGFVNYVQQFAKGQSQLDEKRVFSVPLAYAPWLGTLITTLLRRMSEAGKSLEALAYFEDGLGTASAWMAENLRLAARVCQRSPPVGASWLGHSLRSGGATAAYVAGVPLAAIQLWGGWQPMSQVINRYIRVSAESFDDVEFIFTFLKQ